MHERASQRLIEFKSLVLNQGIYAIFMLFIGLMTPIFRPIKLQSLSHFIYTMLAMSVLNMMKRSGAFLLVNNYCLTRSVGGVE